MTPIRRNQEGAASGMLAILAVIAVVLVLILAVANGIIDFNLPGGSIAIDKPGDLYTETVNRRANDVGMLVPFRITIEGTQWSTGDNSRSLRAILKPYHESPGSDGNHVPTPTLVTATAFNTDVGTRGSNAIYTANGLPFKNTNATVYDSTMISFNGVSVGKAQTNYHAWTEPASPTPSTAKENTGILIQTIWEHRQKATGRVLESAAVNLLLYVDTPAYNAKAWSESKTYTAYFFVPFNDYSGGIASSALMEDISCYVFGYFERADIEWSKISVVTRTYYDFPNLNKFFPDIAGQIKLVNAKDTTYVSSIQYSWVGPTDYAHDNDENPWSHNYLYKIR